MTDETQEHSVLSPSSAHRWRRCAGSVNAERGIPDRVGREAAEGTLFHEHAEIALRLGIDPYYFRTGLPNIIDGHSVSYDDEMIEHLTNGLAFIENLLAEDEDAIIYVEQKVPISTWTGEDGGKGTSDVCIIFPILRKVIIFDWKYGMVPVSPVENDQESLYGLGCWEKFASKYFDGPADIEVDFIIWQPRIPGGGGKWSTTMEALLEEGEKIKLDAAATYDPDAKRTPGTKQCMYCKASSKCADLAAYNLEQYSIRFDELDEGIEWNLPPADPDFMDWTPERRAYVLLHRKIFNRWFDKLHEAALRDIAEGRIVPYMKTVQGPAGDREWLPSELDSVHRVLIAELGEDKVITKKTISPAQAQKLLGKRKYDKLVKAYVTQKPGKPILVPETDGREALPTNGQMFDELFEDEESNRSE
jgi:hypothetical protein